MPEQLSDEHKALGYLLTCPAWDSIYKARLAEQAQIYNRQLIDRSTTRKNTYPDDFLAGAIYALNWAVTWPDQELNKAAAELLERVSSEAVEEEPLVGGSRPSLDEEEG
jgi:hypothetical protein